MNKKPTFSILITTKNRKGELFFTLNSIVKSITEDVEIVVYDDGSSDGTSDMVKESFPTVSLFRNETSKGLIACRNLMLNATKSEFAISLDDDSHFVSDNNFNIIADFFNDNQDCGVIGFRVFWGKQLPNDCDSAEVPFRVKGFVGCGHVWRMKAWNAIPNYPEWFVFYGEEDFASYHLLKKNWTIVYHPTIFVQHRVDVKSRRNDSDNLKRTRMSLRSGLYLFFLFLPFRVAVYSFLSSIWVQIKNKILKGDRTATIAFFQVMIDVLINIPRLIRYRDTLTKKEYSIFKQLPDPQIFWRPK